MDRVIVPASAEMNEWLAEMIVRAVIDELEAWPEAPTDHALKGGWEAHERLQARAERAYGKVIALVSDAAHTFRRERWQSGSDVLVAFARPSCEWKDRAPAGRERIAHLFCRAIESHLFGVSLVLVR